MGTPSRSRLGKLCEWTASGPDDRMILRETFFEYANFCNQALACNALEDKLRNRQAIPDAGLGQYVLRRLRFKAAVGPHEERIATTVLTAYDSLVAGRQINGGYP